MVCFLSILTGAQRLVSQMVKPCTVTGSRACCNETLRIFKLPKKRGSLLGGFTF